MSYDRPMQPRESRVHERYLRHSKKFPNVWCAGCGNGIVLSAIVRAVDELGLDKNEVAMISGLAGILGYVVGIGGTKIGVQLFSGIQASAVPLDWKLAAGSLLTALVIGLAASAYPASMAARLDPNEALRSL